MHQIFHDPISESNKNMKIKIGRPQILKDERLYASTILAGNRLAILRFSSAQNIAILFGDPDLFGHRLCGGAN